MFFLLRFPGHQKKPWLGQYNHCLPKEFCHLDRVLAILLMGVEPWRFAFAAAIAYASHASRSAGAPSNAAHT